MTAFTVVLSPEEDGGYSVSCPAMPGAISEGDSRDEALRNIVEAMEGWWETAIEDGYGPLPETVTLIDEEIAFVLGWKAEEGYELLVDTTVVDVEAPAGVSASGGREVGCILTVPQHPELKEGTVRLIVARMGITMDEFLAAAEEQLDPSKALPSPYHAN